MNAPPASPVWIEILSRDDCEARGMAVNVVQRILDETGIAAHLEVVDITDDVDAEERRVPGSPTIRVDGRDVEPGANKWTDYSIGDRVYRGERGLQGWPDERWVREALLLAAARSTTNGDHAANGGGEDETS
jgi:hypothetical protein